MLKPRIPLSVVIAEVVLPIEGRRAREFKRTVQASSKSFRVKLTHPQDFNRSEIYCIFQDKL